MRVCFTSRRPFPDGRVTQPFPENDPANIAYVLGGDYRSFLTLARLTPRRLAAALQGYDLVFVALDVEAIELAQRIVLACPGRAATYSEGHVASYQLLPPAGQVTFLQTLAAAAVNFQYWEKHVPFYQSLTAAPAAYLPYPYLLDEAARHRLPLEGRPQLAALPSGLAGATRNGLATLAVARRLLADGSVQRLVCWLDPDAFAEDAQALNHFLFGAPFPRSIRPRPGWRRWLTSAQVDYRGLLWLKRRLRLPAPASLQIECLTLHRRRAWPEYLAQLAPARLFVDLNNRETVGRNALDCAALGIACVSTNRSDMQPRLFPDTTLADCWDVDGALALCRRLLRDDEFYRHVTAYAGRAVRQFAPEAFRRRFDLAAAQHLGAVRPGGPAGPQRSG